MNKPNLLASLAVPAAFAFLAAPAGAQDVLVPDQAREAGLESLRSAILSEGIPKPDNIDEFIADRSKAHQLGKALFFDMSVGSDGIQACATCHFHAGADSRITNQINPNLTRVKDQRQGDVVGYHFADGDPDTFFHTKGVNETLERSDFPLVKDIGDGDNVVEVGDTIDPAPGNSNDVISSMGVRLSQFDGITPGQRVDDQTELPDPVFNIHGYNVRRVEPRNTPTMINAVFNFANFWDGRANKDFNGVDPFGNQSDAKIWCADENGDLSEESFTEGIGSLASQAVGPPLSEFEMSARGRQFRDVGRKMLALRPLAYQQVHPKDSLLGSLRDPSGYGLKVTYEYLIQCAFPAKYWDSDKLLHYVGPGDVQVIDADQVSDPANTYTLMEANFSFFYGWAVQAFESILISDWSAFDRWMGTDGSRPVGGFGWDELMGLNVFVGKGKCVSCHKGPEFTGASIRNAQDGNNVIETMLMADDRPALYDNGFYNIGVTPTVEDIGRGGADPWGRPLSYSRALLFDVNNIMSIPFNITGTPIPNLEEDPSDSSVLGFFEEDPVDPENPRFFPVCQDDDGDGKCGTADTFLIHRNAVDGAFKTPGLRNVVLTGPYFHNGGAATLMEVVEFYNRGGNFCRTNKQDLDTDITSLDLTDEEKHQLVAFMISLTDTRVRARQGPFDGPSLRIPNGYDDYGAEQFIDLAATGRNGVPPSQYLRTFLNVSPFSSNPVLGGPCSPNFEEQ